MLWYTKFCHIKYSLLKIVNDTLGHAAGDKLIKDGCSLICEHFTHGAVYRIGGDEFVVILQEKGFDTMLEVIDDINRVIEENIKKKEVVIAIGHSELTKQDQFVRDVFERADQMRTQVLQRISSSRYCQHNTGRRFQSHISCNAQGNIRHRFH